MHFVVAVLAILSAFDLIYGAIRIIRTVRRRSALDGSGQLVIEPTRVYVGRLVRGVAPAVVFGGMLIGAFVAIVHFGGIPPVHEWRK